MVKASLLIDSVFDVEKNVFLPGEQGSYPGISKSLLMITPNERILVDTGFGEIPREGKFGDLWSRVHRSEGQGLLRQLAKRKIKPEQITAVVNTHLHSAHCGNNNLFKNAKFYVSKDEFRFIDKYLDKDPNGSSYYPEMYERVKDFVYVKGEYTLNEDVKIIPTPGHTLGHQSVVANVNGQNLIYSGDVSPLKVNLERKIAMTGYDRTELLHSMKKLLRFKNSKWIFSHDNSQVTLRSIISSLNVG